MPGKGLPEASQIELIKLEVSSVSSSERRGHFSFHDCPLIASLPISFLFQPGNNFNCPFSKISVNSIASDQIKRSIQAIQWWISVDRIFVLPTCVLQGLTVLFGQALVLVVLFRYALASVFSISPLSSDKIIPTAVAIVANHEYQPDETEISS